MQAKSKRRTAKTPALSPADKSIIDAQSVESSPIDQNQIKSLSVVSNQKKILSEQPEEEENPDSIWLQERFPQTTRPIEFTPIQLKQAILDFGNSDTNLTTLLKNKSIDKDTFFKLIGLYSEIAEAYSVARSRKADIFGEKVVDIWDGMPEDEELYVFDKDGNKSLSTAAASYLKAKSDNMMRIAQFHETKSFVPASKQEINQRTIGVTITGRLPEGFDLTNAQPGDLIDAIKGRAKRV
jgi:hypothetical protein